MFRKLSGFACFTLIFLLLAFAVDAQSTLIDPCAQTAAQLRTDLHSRLGSSARNEVLERVRIGQHYNQFVHDDLAKEHRSFSSKTDAVKEKIKALTGNQFVKQFKVIWLKIKINVIRRSHLKENARIIKNWQDWRSKEITEAKKRFRDLRKLDKKTTEKRIKQAKKCPVFPSMGSIGIRG